jgi:hypothetical protein
MWESKPAPGRIIPELSSSCDRLSLCVPKTLSEFLSDRIGKIGAMIALVDFVLAVLASPFKSKSRLEAENAALRHQLIVLRRKVRGRAQLTRAYFGIPGNSTCLGRFRLQVMKAWRRVLLRRSQRPKLSWERFNAILKFYPIPIGHVRDWRYQMGHIK